MSGKVLQYSTLLSLFLGLALLSSGCRQQASETNGRASSTTATAQTDDDPSYGGWWCVEHGVPEKECSQCSTEAADKFKTKGDWCEKHNRAESQCFLCDPSRAEKFAKLYEAKVGHKPPELEPESDSESEGE